MIFGPSLTHKLCSPYIDNYSFIPNVGFVNDFFFYHIEAFFCHCLSILVCIFICLIFNTFTCLPIFVF